MRTPEPLSTEAQDRFGNALEQLLSDLLKRADEERRQTEPWKNLFAASEQGLRGILSEAKNQMAIIAHSTSKIITEKFGVRCSNKLYGLILALPYAMQQLRDAIQDQHGRSCCADKAREVYYQEVLEEIRKLVDEKAGGQDARQ